MESYIQITKLNDYIFCPMSLYLHGIYGAFKKEVFQQKPQIAGTFAHESIDQQKYSSSQNFLIGIPVYSEKYRIAGKIDIYDKDKKLLRERKNKINVIYPGYRYQLYAQMLCLEEMGYEVTKLELYSMSDNNTYTIPLPNADEMQDFQNVIQAIQDFSPDQFNKESIAPQKCNNCIYRELCKP